jgi:hypothetical protein
MIVRLLSLASAFAVMTATSGLAQGHSARGSPLTGPAIKNNHLALDVGLLQVGLSYGRRIGHGRLSMGAGVWGAWEPWNSVEKSVFEPVGGELFARFHPSDAAHLEIGPSLLRYLWADDCSECTGTFVGVHAAAMVGKGVISLGPTIRFGALTGGPSGTETGILWGIQGRLLFSWGD